MTVYLRCTILYYEYYHFLTIIIIIIIIHILEFRRLPKTCSMNKRSGDTNTHITTTYYTIIITTTTSENLGNNEKRTPTRRPMKN